MALEINDQWDFFRQVQLDDDGSLLVKIIGDSAYTANYYTTAATLSGTVISFDRNDLTNAYSVDLNPIVSAITSDNFYTTGATLIGDTVYFDRNDLLSAYTLSLSAFSTDNFYVTGGTFDKSTSELTLQRNDGVSVIVSGFTDFYTTGATLSGTVISFDRNDLTNAYSIDLESIIPDVSFTAITYLNCNGSSPSVIEISLDGGAGATVGFEYNADGGFCGGISTPAKEHPYKVDRTSQSAYTFAGEINVISIDSLTQNAFVTLPEYPIRDFYVVKDNTGNAGLYPITVSAGNKTINKENNYIINIGTKPSITFLWDGQGYITI
jgi:hypothetical protein